MATPVQTLYMRSARPNRIKAGALAIEGHDLPIVIATIERAAANHDLLIRQGHRGFEVLFGSSASPLQLTEFLAARAERGVFQS